MRHSLSLNARKGFMKIKVILYLLSAFSFVGFLSGCKGGSKITPEEFKIVQDTLQMEIDAFRSSLATTDTAIVKQKCEECMEQFKRNNIDLALSELYIYENGKTEPLPDEVAEQQRKKLALMPVLNYELASFNFATEDNNDVKYKVQFDENDPQAITYFMFNPIKIEGTWYLTIKNIGEAVNLGN